MTPWVQKTLASLSLDEKLGQLLHPNVRPHWTEEDLKKAFPPVRLGGAFIFSGPGADFARVARLLQSGPGVPLVISTDLESGAGRMISGATSFPDLMSLAAANDLDLVRRMGEATAVEARAYGVHWTFGPVVDVNAHPGNPITNTRGLGDDPKKIARLATALVESMQAHGLAATVKHFPGDGWDDRDQHLATTVNPLSLKQWEKTNRRFRPRTHAFSYSMFMVYLDLDELDAVFAGRWLWSTSRPAIARFRRQDYGGEPELPLGESIRRTVESHTGRRPGGPIRLLTHLAYYGWSFNPVSLYYCFDTAGTRVETVVCEVSNTPWLERHFYVLDRAEGHEQGGAMRFRKPKAFHVSPFMAMDQEYVWALREPSESLVVHMENLEGGAPIFDATMTLRREPITTRSLAGALARWPFMTATVVGGIHWEALKLWLKRVPVFTHPGKRAAASR